jgi:hypothetical protein
MAAAGMRVVTSTFENKTADALRAISGNLIPVEPTVAEVTAGLAEAVASLDDFEGRAREAAIRWSRSWDHSLDDEVIARIKAFVEAA